MAHRAHSNHKLYDSSNFNRDFVQKSKQLGKPTFSSKVWQLFVRYKKRRRQVRKGSLHLGDRLLSQKAAARLDLNSLGKLCLGLNGSAFVCIYHDGHLSTVGTAFESGYLKQNRNRQ